MNIIISCSMLNNVHAFEVAFMQMKSSIVNFLFSVTHI